LFEKRFRARKRPVIQLAVEAVQIKARSEARLVELGRDRAAFGFESIRQYTRGDNHLPGDIAAWRDAGGRHISVVTMGANLTTVGSHLEAIRRWRDVYHSVYQRSVVR
jgi:hypothetical protein